MFWDLIDSIAGNPPAQPKRSRKGGGGGKKRKADGPNPWVKVTTVKPYCMPSRNGILTALKPYGIPVRDDVVTDEPVTTSLANAAKLWKIELRTRENLKYGPMGLVYLPIGLRATFYVPARQVRQAHYWLEYSGKFAVDGVDPKIRAAANKRLGRMPTPWDKEMGMASSARRGGGTRPLIEDTCQDGISAWAKAREALEAEAKKQNAKGRR